MLLAHTSSEGALSGNAVAENRDLPAGQPLLERGGIARVSHQHSSRGQRGAVPSGVYDPRGAESYFTVRRAPRGEKTPPGAVHRWPQQKASEKCGLRPSGHPDRVEGGKRGQRSGIGAITHKVGGGSFGRKQPAGAPSVLTGRAVSDDFGSTDSRCEWMTLAQTSSEGALTGNATAENRDVHVGRHLPERSGRGHRPRMAGGHEVEQETGRTFRRAPLLTIRGSVYSSSFRITNR